MRWRTKRREEPDAGGHVTDEPPAPSSGAPDPGWAALPPIASTWSARTPLTAQPTTVAPPLTHEPRRAKARPLDRTDDLAPEPGRVIGLAAVVRPTATRADLVERPAAPAYFPDQPPLRHVTARPLVEHAPLTEATDAYVGEPLARPSAPPPSVPAPPVRPVSRPSEPAVEATTDAGARFREALANLHSSGLPRYVSPSDGEGPAQPPTPPPAAAPPSPGLQPPTTPAPPPWAADGPRLTHRRNTLAQSRRLGLGAPVRPGESSEEGGDESGPDGPAADAEPARAALPAPPPLPVQPPTPPLPPPPAPAVEHSAPPAALPPDRGEGGTGLRDAGPPVVVPTRPIVDGPAYPSAAAAPLVFRARAPRGGERATVARPPERAVVSRPPAELAQALRSSHGIDVSDVPIRRDSEAGHEADRRRARAFTRGAKVYLPESAGDVASRETRALLVHELVHAAQQRRLGGALPAESTPEGRALEAEAVAAEQAYGGSPSLTPTDPLRHAPRPVTAAWVDDRITQHALPEGSEPTTYRFLSEEENRNEVAWIAKKVVQAAQAEGGLGGAGGGGGGSSDLSMPSVGSVGAASEQEFQAAILAAYNLELQMRGESTVTSLNDAQRQLAHGQWVNAEQERKRAQDRAERLKEERAKVAKERQDRLLKEKDKDAKDEQQTKERQQTVKGATDKATELAGLSWTPKDGFQKNAGGSGTNPSKAAAAAAAALTALTTASEGSDEEAEAAETLVGVPKPDTKTTSKKKTVELTNLEKAQLVDDPEILTGIRTFGEFEESALANYNLERQMRGMDPVAGFSPAERAQLQQSFAVAQGNAQRKSLEEAARKDRQIAREKEARDAKRATLGLPSEDDEATGAAQTEAAKGGSAVGATAQQIVAPAAHDPFAADHLEQLADRIYDRLRRKLRTELIVDRERAGLLTDFR